MPYELLPMVGRTHGSRSPVTCHLRCGDACFKPVPNTTETSYFRDVASSALSRRTVVGAGAVAIGAAFASAVPAAATTRPRAAGTGLGAPKAPAAGGLEFTPIKPVAKTVDEFTVPDGYRWTPIIRWGDPILKKAPVFDPADPDPKAQAAAFGYNNDYTNVVETNRAGTRGLLMCNHEYTNEAIMFPADTDPEALIRTVWAAHGLSVVELKRSKRGEPWTYVPGAPLNRRITLDTPFAVDGPAAGSAYLRTKADPKGRTVRGTMNNCSGGYTPWGTVLSGEENFNQYFLANGTSDREKRYGLGAQDARKWREIDPRWDATKPDYVNEPNRFGWIVEIDPDNPRSTPVKHTAMGRFKHEGANVIIARSGKVVAYMGDDERFDYVYRFVSRDKYRTGASSAVRKHNKQLLSNGDLSVARFTGNGLEDGVSDGTGEWIPLTKDGRSVVPGFTTAEVLVFTRLAADAVQPTKMDRPEDVQPNLKNGKIYVACTNNTDRGKAGKEGPTEPNPRNANKDGHVVEIDPKGNHTGKTFEWNLLLICGDPATAGTYFGGYDGEVSPISCPDNVAFDSVGNLWVSTDGAPSTLGTNDGLFKVPLEGEERGRVQQFLSVPTEAETCGPVVRDKDGSVFVAVQHPGENGTWAAQTSKFPDYVEAGATPGKGQYAAPRPSIVQITRSV